MNYEHFSYFDWNSAKKLQKVIFFIFTEQSKSPLRFGLPLKGKCINPKKLNMWTFLLLPTKSTNQSWVLWVSHLGGPASNINSVGLGI